MRDAVLARMGIACLPDLRAASLISSGRLVQVFETFWPSQPGFLLYYSFNGHPSAAFKAVIDFVRAPTRTNDLTSGHADHNNPGYRTSARWSA